MENYILVTHHIKRPGIKDLSHYRPLERNHGLPGTQGLSVKTDIVWDSKDGKCQDLFNDQRVMEMITGLYVFVEKDKFKDRFGKSITLQDEQIALYDAIMGKYQVFGMNKEVAELTAIFVSCFPDKRTIFPAGFLDQLFTFIN